MPGNELGRGTRAPRASALTASPPPASRVPRHQALLPQQGGGGPRLPHDPRGAARSRGPPPPPHGRDRLAGRSPRRRRGRHFQRPFSERVPHRKAELGGLPPASAAGPSPPGAAAARSRRSAEAVRPLPGTLCPPRAAAGVAVAAAGCLQPVAAMAP